MRRAGPKPYPVPNCPDCGKLTRRTGQRARRGMRFECLNPECRVIEIRVHPKPDMTLDDLPPENVITAHVQGFNPYAKVILNLINIFREAIESPP